jgi:hypothetical protein
MIPTPDEAAVKLRRSKRWLYRNSKKLPFIRRISPRSFVCSEAGIQKWLAGRKV